VSVTGLVFDIQRFAVHDGPGIRTTVFLKGCPLRCLWCHNPESIDPRPEIAWRPERCIGCLACVGVCPHGCHRAEAGGHVFDRASCVRCGLCTEQCWSGALERVGREMTVAQALEPVLADRPFYASSGGGMTISGGEPLHQAEFTTALLAAAKAEGLHTCLDTSGQAAWERLEAVLPHVDIFLFDVKETEPEAHRRLTGADGRLILANLEGLSAAGASIVFRCPIVPGLNDRPAHLAAIGVLASRLPGVRRVDLLPYHRLGSAKLASIGREAAPAADRTPEAAETAAWAEEVRRHTAVDVRVGG
jgi:glycyl-radical enzyme activating protein